MTDENERISMIESRLARLEQWAMDHDCYSKDNFTNNHNFHERLMTAVTNLDHKVDQVKAKLFRYEYIALGIGMSVGMLVAWGWNARHWIVNRLGH